MEPVFTIQWTEFLVTERLAELLPKKKGYSVLVPTSRQEKGFDVAVVRRSAGTSRVVTIQVKASRTYPGKQPGVRSKKKHFRHNTWFNRFEVPAEADFFVLVSIYAPEDGSAKKVGARWYKSCMLLFEREKMKKFMASCKTRRGKPDRMFGFGFDNPERKVAQTRGDKDMKYADFKRLLLNKHTVDRLRRSLR